jgi:hypothetical protein
MLRPEQHALPPALSGALDRIVVGWEAGDKNAVEDALITAIEAAQALQFLHLPAAVN